MAARRRQTLGVAASALVGAGGRRAVRVKAVDGLIASVASVLLLSALVAAEAAARVKAALVKVLVRASDGAVARA